MYPEAESGPEPVCPGLDVQHPPRMLLDSSVLSRTETRGLNGNRQEALKQSLFRLCTIWVLDDSYYLDTTYQALLCARHSAKHTLTSLNPSAPSEELDEPHSRDVKVGMQRK